MDQSGRNSTHGSRLRSDSVVFIETRLDAFHPGFANPPSHYDERLQGFVIDDYTTNTETGVMTVYNPSPGTLGPPSFSPSDLGSRLLPPRMRAEPGTALQFWDQLFPQAMDQHVTTHPDEPSEIKKKGRRIRDKNSWNDVYDELEAAKDAYSQTDTGFKGVLRKVYRKSADRSADINVAVLKTGQNVLNNEYVTPVLGALQVVLEASAKAVKLRQDMVAAFDDIDRRFAEVEVYLQAFKGDENIRVASIDLIAAVLHAVELVLSFFVSRTYKRVLRSTFTMDQYRDKIDQSLRDIETKSSNLLREVNMSRTHREGIFQQQVLYDTTVTKFAGTQLHRMMNRGRNEMKSMFDNLMHKMNSIEAAISRSPSPVSPSHLYKIAAILPETGGAGRYNTATTDEVLDWIGIPNLAEEDLEFVATHSHVDISDAQQGRAEQLVMTHQLQEWLSSPASSQLLIHGNYDDVRPVSGLSLLCASLALNLDSRNNPRLIRMLFFCGLNDGHRDHPGNIGSGSDDPFVPLVGGRAIIASFICQLLGAFDFGPELPLPCLGDAQVQEAVHYGDVDALCFVFEELVRRLPRGVVLLCMLDGAVYYERPEFVDDAYQVLEQLLLLSQDVSVSAVVKLLVTSPTHTTTFRELFGHRPVLSLDAAADTQWEASQSRTQRLLSGQTILGEEGYANGPLRDFAGS
ncbi:hypothetical protein B0I35DRAFT_474336 [Stachybotrys elegans]|uniref:Fungal STAND N-terminal Goodbye domain-containing protein n=1 Tax=Stachybotrys elegans TaxID=80388 RepID=A0A8K0SZA2_9HYPO|nr:hypothetical protein B0I35DRAFT_474336 [Stachybotrys elegans]